jgi:hypothetical protein
MLRTVMGRAEEAKQRAALTYDLTVADTRQGGQAQTEALLKDVGQAVTQLVKHRNNHVPAALQTKGRDEFSRAEGGLKPRDRVVLEIYQTEQNFVGE